ncbi:hypothetical protein [Caballeronia udeis]|uniref:hypothetical protein n=1 Tax=Caballeronia udeis TaxID=1232866 RepID=UPI000B048723|nr:hypothetical protein [Caballeronia udeis]
MKAAAAVDDDQINLMRIPGVTECQVFTKLVIPASLRDIFAGLKLTVDPARLPEPVKP